MIDLPSSAGGYVVVKTLHMSLALASVGLFTVRGLGRVAGAAFPLARPLRRLSQAIDTCLLISAIALLVLLGLNPLTTPWLVAKLALLLGYIALGMLALHRARTRAGRVLALVAALTCFAVIVAIARSHDPLIAWRLFAG